MILKSLPATTTPSAPITYFFDHDQIRVEIHQNQISNLFSLCVWSCRDDVQTFNQKLSLRHINSHSIQYSTHCRRLIYQTSPSELNICTIDTGEIEALTYPMTVIAFEIDHTLSQIAALCSNGICYLRSLHHEQHQITGVEAFDFRQSSLYYLKTDGYLYRYHRTDNEVIHQKLFSLPTANGLAPLKIKTHPSLPIIAFTNNQFSLRGEGIGVTLHHLNTQQTIGKIAKINKPIRTIQWWPKDNRIAFETFFHDTSQPQNSAQHAIEIVTLDNFHEHYTLECPSMPLQVRVAPNGHTLHATHHNISSTWQVPSRQSKTDRYNLAWTLASGAIININGVKLLKIVHASVQEHLKPFIRINRNTAKSTLQKVESGLDWLKLAGRLATFVSGEIADQKDCDFVKQASSKLYGNITVGCAPQQTVVATRQEHVEIPHSENGSYVAIAHYINKFLDQFTEQVSAQETYRTLCSVLKNSPEAPEQKRNNAHADLATVLLARLSLHTYPEHFTSENTAFFDSLLVLLFGMEASRINSSYLTGVMMLDLIANQVTFGRFQRTFSWQNMFTSGPGYQWNDFEQKDYGGKYPLASNSTGPENFSHRTNVVNAPELHELNALQAIMDGEQHYQVCKKEIKVVLAWLNNLNVQARNTLSSATTEDEFIGQLKTLFKQRIRDVFVRRPTIPTPILQSNHEGLLRQYELRSRDQQLTARNHYYLKITNQSSDRVVWDQYYHRVDTPCKMTASDFVMGDSKTIKPKRQKQQTRARLLVTTRSVTGVTKTFNITSLTDGFIASENEQISLSRRTTTITPVKSELIADTIMGMIIGDPNYARKRHRTSAADPVTLNGATLAAMRSATVKCIESYFMPHFDFFADVQLDCEQEYNKIDYIERSRWIDQDWLKNLSPNLLYDILTELSFKDVVRQNNQLCATMTLSTITNSIRRHAPLPEEQIKTLAKNILERVAQILTSQNMNPTELIIPEVVSRSIHFIPGSDASDVNFGASINPLFSQALRQAFIDTSHLLQNNEMFQLAQKILSKISAFHIERRFTVTREEHQSLAPCPRCYAESAPPFPGLPYAYDQSICLIADNHPSFHRLQANPTDQICRLVDSEQGVIQVETQKLPTTITFVKHARDVLGKQRCESCWLPAVINLTHVGMFNHHRNQNGQERQSSSTWQPGLK